jgi:hypothetical protein
MGRLDGELYLYDLPTDTNQCIIHITVTLVSRLPSVAT